MPHGEQRPEPAAVGEIRFLAARARAGDASVLPRLRETLRANPSIWAYAGDLERVVAKRWAETLANGDPLATEAVTLKADALRSDLAGETPTALESLLVSQVVVVWMELAHAQLRTAEPKGESLAKAALDVKRAESAQRKFLAAMKTLAVVRHLLPRGLMPSATPRLFDPAQKLA